MSRLAARAGVSLAALFLLAAASTAAYAAHAARGHPSASAVAPVSAELLAARAALAAQTWARAETLATTGLAAARAPVDSADWIAALLLARWRNDHEKLPGTSALAERALAIRLGAPGPDSLPLAIAYEGSGYGLAGLGRARDGEPRIQAALDIRTRRAAGPDPDIIRLQHLLGVFAYQRSDYAQARTRFAVEVGAREAFTPRDPVEIARATMSLASATSVLGDHAAAVTLYQRSLALLDQAPVASDRDRLYALNSLVLALGGADRLAEAVELAHRAVELAERSLGPDHAQTGYAHRSLGYAYSALGDYASAREEEAHAMEVLARAYGPAHDQVAQTRRMLAAAASKSGDFETALPITRDVLAQLRAASEPDAIKIVDALNSEAFALTGLGRRAEAMAAYEEALGWCERTLGPGHPRTSFLMANLAGECLDAGQVARAESLLVGARALTVARDGPRHSSEVQILRGLSIVSATRKEWAHADSLLDEAVAIAGATSTDLAPALLDRARERADAGRAELAAADALAGAALHRAQARLLADGLSEREALRFAAADPSGLPIAISIATEFPLAPATRRAVWDAAIRARARIADDMAERLHLAADPPTDSLADAFRRTSADLSAALLRGSSPARADSLRRARESLEVALGRASARWGGDRADEQLGFDDVERALPEGAALVAYVRHAWGHASDAVGRDTPRLGYSVFVLPARGRDPLVLSLGEAARLDTLVSQWNALAGRAVPANPGEARALETRMRAVGEKLRARVWDPVRARLGAAPLVLVVPDGALQLVNLETLPDGKGWLVEHGPTLHALTAERDLVRRPAATQGAGLLAFGAPDFDAGIVDAAAGPVALRGVRPPCGRFDALRFPALPAALAEMDSVVALWRGSTQASEPSRVVSGADASEPRFKREAGGHRVLHLATHGFFLDAACLGGSGGRGVATLAEWTPPAAASPGRAPEAPRLLPGAVAGNPLMLSGLVLSAANHRADAGNGDDGVLTAQEIAALDLSGTEWAVLSACRTGMGEVLDGEGVSGLRRAFRLAGVRTVISSVWPVSDADARAWMEALYRARLAHGSSTAQAVREASLARLNDLRAHHAPALPVAWGAFFAGGDWR